MVPTGTNLLGLVKHCARWEYVYLGDTFGRSADESVAWIRGDVEPNGDMWATADESRNEIVQRYREAWAHSDATIDALGIDAIGHVPHWPAGQNEVTLHQVLVHVIVDTQRHAGQADIIREQIDGSVGLLSGNDNMWPADQDWWTSHRDRLQSVADSFDRH
jgi:hypothetical protein